MGTVSDPASEPSPPKRKRTRRSRNELHRLIVDAARKCFAERGYSAVTIREIAEAANVPLPTLYKFFAEKREIYEYCCKTSALNHFDYLSKILSDDLSGEECLYVMLRSGIDMNINQSTDYHLVNRLLFEGEADVVKEELRLFSSFNSYKKMNGVFSRFYPRNEAQLRMIMLDRFFGQLNVVRQVWDNVLPESGEEDEFVISVLNIVLPDVDWLEVQGNLRPMRQIGHGAAAGKK